MKPFFQAVGSFFGGSQTAAKRRRFPRQTPSVEEMESRTLLSRMIVLDFDGATAAEDWQALTALPGWRNPNEAVPHPSFVGELGALNTNYGGYSRYSFLDLNNDGRLNRADGEMAAGFIMAKISERYAPYDIRVIREDDTSRALARMNDGFGGDVLLFMNGFHTGSGGQAAGGDCNNIRDDVGGAGASVGGARTIANWGFTGAAARDAFFNLMANMAAHEAGHTFGLDHVNVVVHPDAVSLMTPTLGADDLRFPNIPYQTTGTCGATQNAHQELLRVLGGRWQPMGGNLTSIITARHPVSDVVYLFGVAPDGTTWRNTHLGGDRWTGWQFMGGNLASIRAAHNQATGRLELFGIAPDGTPWVNALTGPSWSGWLPLGGVLASLTTAYNYSYAGGTRHLQLFGIAPDGAPFVNTHVSGDTWSGWRSLGGTLTSVTTAYNYAVGRLQLFGIAPDGRPFVNTHTSGDDWSGWQLQDGVLLASLTAVSNRAIPRLQLFGISTDGRPVVNTHIDGAAWSGWEELGGTLTSLTTAQDPETAQLQLFGVASDGTTWVNTHIGDGIWSGWQFLGGTLTSITTGLDPYTGQRQLYGIAPDGTTWVNTHIGDGTWSGWQSLDGIAASLVFVDTEDGLMMVGIAPDGTIWRRWR